MNEQSLWRKLNEQLNAEYIDQLDKHFIIQNSIYFESEFAKIRRLDSGFAFPPLINQKLVGELDGLTPAGKDKYNDLKRKFSNQD